MKRIKLTTCFLCITICLAPDSYAQTNSDSLATKNFELKNDTLFSGSGARIYPGQKLVLGNPAGANGRYRSIVSRYAAIVPNIWGHNNGYENMIENYVDNKKGKKQLAELTPGQVFTIGKIGMAGAKQFKYFPATLLTGDSYYRCDILLALRLGELILQ